MRVVERGEHMRFALEACHAVGVTGEEFREHLEGDLASELGIAGAIHLAHAAHPDRGDHLVGSNVRAASEAHGAVALAILHCGVGDWLRAGVESLAPMELKRDLGLWSAVAIVIGTVIGSGIFLVPTRMIERVGTPGMVFFVWIFGGALSLFGALSYA